MKKIIIIVCSFLSIFLCSCNIKSTPTKSVEMFLSKYITNDEEIVVELDDYVNDSELTKEASIKYKEVYLKQFRDLKYNIKEEKIDGDNAIVVADVTVYDYYKKEEEANKFLEENPDKFKKDGKLDKDLFTDYKLDLFKSTVDRVTYSIDFNLTRIDNSWIINDLNNDQLKKIHGVFEH